MASSTQSRKNLLELTIRKSLLPTADKRPLKTENQLESTTYWPAKNRCIALCPLCVTESQRHLQPGSGRPPPAGPPAVARRYAQLPHSPAGRGGALQPIALHMPRAGAALSRLGQKFWLERMGPKGQLLTGGQSGQSQCFISMSFSSLPMTSRFDDFMAQPSHWRFLILALDNY